MNAPVDHKTSIACANIALGSIKALRAAGDPRNYAAWFTYATNCSPSNNETVNRIVARDGGIEPAEIEKIYGYAPASLIADEAEALARGVAQQVEQALAVVEAAAGMMAGYHAHLAEVADALDRVEDRDHLSAIVDDLILATRRVEARNETFAALLNGSREGIGEVRQRLDSLHSEVLTDTLTQLANRRSFEHELDRCMAEADASKGALCLLLMDIDHLQNVNHAFGHVAGDEVIRVVSHSLKQHVQPHDVAARVGGEEFAVILPRISLRSALTVADHIRRRVMAMQFMKRSTGESMGRVTISGGIARYRLGETPWAFMQRADRCLTAAKRHGRNRVICDNDELVAA